MPTTKPFQCQECGKLHTLRSAERIMSGGRCDCGGCDIDIAPVRPGTYNSRGARLLRSVTER
jgi:hypothetical protein